MYKKDENYYVSGKINFDFNSKIKVPDQKGYNLIPIWLSLAHEMAHAEDAFRGTISFNFWGQVGKKKVAVAEQYSTHVENKIRAQSGLPLRTHYGAKITDTSTEGVLDILDEYGNSLFYTEPAINIENITEVPCIPPKVEVLDLPYNYKNHKK